MEAEPHAIERRLSAFDASMVVVSLVIGIGIFRTPAIVAAAAGSPGRFLGVWAAGGIVSLIGALTFAEIGSRFPRAGGYYRVVADAYHPALAFMLNWAQALMQGAGAAGVAFIGAEYLGVLIGRRGGTLVTACLLMIVLLALNFAGIRAGARTQNALSMAKIVMIVGVALFGLATSTSGAAPLGAPPSAPADWWLIAAAIPVFYTYGGYQLSMNLAGDVRDPARSLPRAILGGMALVTALYLLVNIAYVRALGLAGVAQSKLVAAALAAAAFGPRGESVVSLLIFLSAAGFVNATILSVPRSYYAMAEDGTLPAAFRRVNPKTQAQEVGLLFMGATMLIPALWLGSFEKLLNYVMFTDALTLVVVASTLFVLRRRRVGESGGFRMPGYPWLPGVFMACLIGVAVHVAITETRLALAGLAIFAAGWPLFRGARAATGRS